MNFKESSYLDGFSLLLYKSRKYYFVVVSSDKPPFPTRLSAEPS